MKINNIHGGDIFQWARHFSCAPEAVIDFSANINPLGYSQLAIDEMVRAIPLVRHYPDPAGRQLKQVIAGQYSVNVDQLILGNGAAELLYLCCQAVKPETVLITGPAFSEYERAARAAGAAVRCCILPWQDNFKFPLDEFLSKIPINGIIFLGNPNNPDGTLLSWETGREILETAAKRHTKVIIDESFFDFLPTGLGFSFSSVVKNYPGLIILHSLTKFYAVPGLRLGFAITSKELVKQLELLKDVWNVNTLAQVYGTAALQDDSYRRKTVQFIQQEQCRFYTELQSLPQLKVYEPTVNFMLCHIQCDLTVEQLQQQLLKKKILIRNCSGYDGLDEYFFRIAVKQTNLNKLLYQILREVLQ